MGDFPDGTFKGIQKMLWVPSTVKTSLGLSMIVKGKGSR